MTRLAEDTLVSVDFSEAEAFCQATKKRGPCKGWKAARAAAGPQPAPVAKAPAPARKPRTKAAPKEKPPPASVPVKAPPKERAKAPAKPRASRAAKKAPMTDLEAAKARISQASADVYKPKKASTSKRRLKVGGAVGNKRIREAIKENTRMGAGQKVVKTESKQPNEDYSRGSASKAKKKEYHPLIGWHSEGDQMDRDEMIGKLEQTGYSRDELKDASDELLASMLRHEESEGDMEEGHEFEDELSPATGEEMDQETGTQEEPEDPANAPNYDEETAEGDEDEDEPELHEMADEDLDNMPEDEMRERVRRHVEKMRSQYAEAGEESDEDPDNVDKNAEGASGSQTATDTPPNKMPADMSPPKYRERGGNVAAVKFSELRDQIAAELLATIKPMLHKEVRGAFNEFREFKQEALNTDKRKLVTKFAETMVKEGRLEPKRLKQGKNGEPSIIDHLMSLPTQGVHQFTDKQGNKRTLSPLRMAMNEIRQRTPFKFGERLKTAAGSVGGTTLGSEQKQQAAMLCEKFAETFSKVGTSKEEFMALMNNPKIQESDKAAVIADLERASAA